MWSPAGPASGSRYLEYRGVISPTGKRISRETNTHNNKTTTTSALQSAAGH